jgi:hypothetical protein
MLCDTGIHEAPRARQFPLDRNSSAESGMNEPPLSLWISRFFAAGCVAVILWWEFVGRGLADRVAHGIIFTYAAVGAACGSGLLGVAFWAASRTPWRVAATLSVVGPIWIVGRFLTDVFALMH